MIDEDQRARYWLYTLILTICSVSLIVACAFVLPLFTVELNADTFLGFPLGYYLAAQGMMIILIVAVYWTGGRQTETDQKFGATEDL